MKTPEALLWDARRRLEDQIEAYADARVHYVSGDQIMKAWVEVMDAIDEMEEVQAQA